MLLKHVTLLVSSLKCVWLCLWLCVWSVYNVPHELQDHSDQICSIVTWVIFKGSAPHISVCSCSLSFLCMCTSLHTREKSKCRLSVFAWYVFEDDPFNISLDPARVCVCVCALVCYVTD